MPIEPEDDDAQLDQAIHAYIEAEPLAGLEQRILNRVCRGDSHPKWVSLWPASAASGAVLVACLVFWITRSQPVVTAPERRHLDPQPAQLAHAEPVYSPPTRHVVHRARRIRPRALRKPDVLPVPLSPNAEERALLQFAANDPKQAAATLANLNAPSKPLEVPELTIEPLQKETAEK